MPFCQHSQWFECPCHGSKYNTAGEYKLGPAPRGMDRFKVEVTETGDVWWTRPSRSSDRPGAPTRYSDPPSGPFCVAVQMLGLTQAQGIILAVGGAIFVAIAAGASSSSAAAARK